MPHTCFDFLELISAWWGMKPFSVAVWLIPPHSLLLCHSLSHPQGNSTSCPQGVGSRRSFCMAKRPRRARPHDYTLPMNCHPIVLMSLQNDSVKVIIKMDDRILDFGFWILDFGLEILASEI
jgi:hypothetical protein